MKYSESLANIATALAKVQSEIKNPIKNQVNKGVQGAPKYANLEDTLQDYVRPICSKYGISVYQSIKTNENGQVGVCTVLIHESGEFIEKAKELCTVSIAHTAADYAGAKEALFLLIAAVKKSLPKDKLQAFVLHIFADTLSILLSELTEIKIRTEAILTRLRKKNRLHTNLLLPLKSHLASTKERLSQISTTKIETISAGLQTERKQSRESRKLLR